VLKIEKNNAEVKVKFEKADKTLCELKEQLKGKEAQIESMKKTHSS